MCTAHCAGIPQKFLYPWRATWRVLQLEISHSKESWISVKLGARKNCNWCFPTTFWQNNVLHCSITTTITNYFFFLFFLTWMCLGRVNGKNLAERHLLVVVGTGLRLKKVAFRNLNLSKLGVCSLLLNVKVSCSDHSSQNLGGQGHEIECRSWF